ncbi:hypothetical protein [Saccharothrix sp. ST-888]|uniref:hypothetical protein n=1 Tax=Saccharothrix sp. ST-888 TaxID=1427391 RepID=UPI0005EC537F|nr:hypothetical protein [Saccharothrix sp. ST-888]KJK57098.1 hypothetical protein UK12_18570 [Saccharothrix sp. ST-888]
MSAELRTSADRSALLDAVERLADRYRAMPQSRLLGAVPGHPSRAAAGLALARQLASAALAAAGEPPHEFPDAGPFAVGDQLAVAGHEFAVAADGPQLAEALAAVRAVAGLID